MWSTCKDAPYNCQRSIPFFFNFMGDLKITVTSCTQKILPNWAKISLLTSIFFLQISAFPFFAFECILQLEMCSILLCLWTDWRIPQTQQSNLDLTCSGRYKFHLLDFLNLALVCHFCLELDRSTAVSHTYTQTQQEKIRVPPFCSFHSKWFCLSTRE